MASSNDYMRGWTQGWIAATEAMMRGLEAAIAGTSAGHQVLSAAMLAAAGNKPGSAVAGPAPNPGEPPRRRRGRPPKIRPA
jgi:cyanophycinase-like exopeptidase